MNGAKAVMDIPAGIRPHDALISMVREMIDDSRNGFREHRPAADSAGGLPGRPGKGLHGGINYSLVLAEDTAVELGAPSERSASLYLWTHEEGAVPEGIWIAGPELSRLSGRPVSYAQVVMVQVRPGASPLDRGPRGLMNLTNRIPGCMTRILQGRIWLRIHRDLLARGFSLADIGETILSLYREEARDTVAQAGVVIVAGTPDLVSRIETIQAMARVINGENHRLQVEEDGSLSCDELSCVSCGEKVFCDVLRDVISARRRNQS